MILNTCRSVHRARFPAVLFAAIILIHGAVCTSTARSNYRHWYLPCSILAIAFIWGKKGGDHVNHDAHLWGSLLGLAFTLILVAVMQPALFNEIMEKLKNPSLFGHD